MFLPVMLLPAPRFKAAMYCNRCTLGSSHAYEHNAVIGHLGKEGLIVVNARFQ